MRVEDYAKYINVLHDLAQVEDDLRSVLDPNTPPALWSNVRVAERILFERFGVDR